MSTYIEYNILLTTTVFHSEPPKIWSKEKRDFTTCCMQQCRYAIPATAQDSTDASPQISFDALRRAMVGCSKDKIGVVNWLVVSNIFYFHPYLGKISILTNIFQRGWNHQLVLFVELVIFFGFDPMVEKNHHFSPAFGEYFCIFPSILRANLSKRYASSWRTPMAQKGPCWLPAKYPVPRPGCEKVNELMSWGKWMKSPMFLPYGSK